MNIHGITLRAIAAATESVDKVKAAMSLFLFDDGIESVTTEGHYGNPITVLQARIKGRNCEKFIKLIRSKLPEDDLSRLKKELAERIDEECCLHIRFDKQAAYKGIVQMAATSDTVAAKIKIKAFPARRENAAAVAETFFR
jgi:RNA binding exosome subunit